MAFLFYGVEMSTVDETIIITTKEYEKLLKDQAFLRALEAAGEEALWKRKNDGQR